ncbi:metallophosphoesterase [Burkholderia diffusa]|uniref:metallophosphoesterase n=1 Tax=Burkholderia diffusa TaxID=488732 RepID=UPI0009BE9594|nr:metallophosphoesterase [Burkholderia diffusa]
MKKITIIHLSDLHLMDSVLQDQQIVLDALFEDIATEREKSDGIDAIFFTGDLVGKGRYSGNARENVVEKFVKPLLDASRISPTNFFITPGNHDVDQSKLTDILRSGLDNLKNVDQVNKLIDEIDLQPYLWMGFDNFNSLRDEIVLADRRIKTPLFESYATKLNGFNVGVCAVNSAWRSSGRSEDYDYGKLLIGERQIDILSRSIADCEIKFAIFHHPLHWLTQFDQAIVQRQILRKFDGVFYGHNHSTDMSAIARPTGKTFVSNAGCLYQDRRYFNGYSIISLEPTIQRWTARVREYFEERQVFAPSERFSDGGHVAFNLSDEKEVSRDLDLPTQDFVQAVTDSVNSQLLSSSISDVAPKDLTQLFVIPPLCSTSEKKLGVDRAENSEAKFLEFNDLFSDNSIIVFLGAREAGKTTLLNYICTRSQPSLGGAVNSIGVYVNLHVLPRLTRSAILEAMVSFSGGSYTKSQILELLKMGKITLAIDNVDVNVSLQVTLIQQFIGEFAKNKFFLSVREDVLTSITENSLPKFSENQKCCYIHSFGRRQTRDLMQRWFRDPNINSHQVDSLLSSLKRLNIPRTPFLISVFLWVHERNIAFDPVNHAEVIDTLIDGMLDKFHETKSRVKLDSTAKRHFLTDLAYYLYQAGKDRLTHNELDLFAAQYFKRRLLTTASGPFIEELTRKGIFIDLGEEVCFKFDCLRAFFLSIRLNESSQFLDEALSRNNLLKLGEELDYFTGKQRGREDALERVVVLLDEFYEPVKLGFDLRIFEEVSANGLPISVKSREEIGKELFPERPNDERREEILDEMDEQAAQVIPPGKQVASSPATGPLPDFVAALQIASAILRNTELVDNAELKRAAYNKIIFYWSEIMLAVVLAAEFYKNDEKLKEFVENLPVEGANFEYALKLMVPNIIFGIVREVLGTAQLEVVIREHADNATYCVEKLISMILHMDLSLPGYTGIVRNFIRSYDGKKYALSVLFMKLVERFMLKSMPQNEVEDLRRLVGDIYPMVNGSKNSMTMNLQKTVYLDAVTKNRKSNLEKSKKI